MNRGGSNSRRSTFSAGEGAENVVNHQQQQQQPSSNSKSQPQPPSSSSKVRWNVDVPPSQTNNNSKLNTSTGISSTKINMTATPSKRIKDRFANVASGKKNDAVFSYHFDGTPFSHKKRAPLLAKKHHHQKRISKERDDEGGDDTIEATGTANLLDNTFHLGNDTTAEILNMNSMPTDLPTDSDLLNNSLLSTASSAADSENSLDVMNCTTLSDTHELSTSNFIQNARMRSVLADRAKMLFGEQQQQAKKKKQQKEREEEERERMEAEEERERVRVEAEGEKTNGGGVAPGETQPMNQSPSDDASHG